MTDRHGRFELVSPQCGGARLYVDLLDPQRDSSGTQLRLAKREIAVGATTIDLGDLVCFSKR